MARFNSKNERASFIIECFEEFYREVLKYKQLVYSKPWKKEDEEDKSSPKATAEYILTSLQTFLEQQAVKAAYGGNSFAENYYSEAQFIMVALADEVFLNLDWPGRTYWESNILEQRMFNTHSAGQVFFDLLENLLQNKDPVRVELAVLYLNALGLDFKGKFRHFNDVDVLKSYRTRLFTFINRREPSFLQLKSTFFPDAYSHTLENSGVKNLPNLRNWYMVFAGIGLTYLLISYVVWYSATFEISRIVSRIITYNSVSG